MIFSDRETAKDIRHEATEQMTEWIIGMCEDVHEYKGDLAPESIRNHVKSKMYHDMPNLLATLLYKSGIIHKNSENPGERPHYPVHLFYDEDSDSSVAQAIYETPGCLTGGIVDGRVHT